MDTWASGMEHPGHPNEICHAHFQADIIICYTLFLFTTKGQIKKDFPFFPDSSNLRL